jgi:hypothetical protein
VTALAAEVQQHCERVLGNDQQITQNQRADHGPPAACCLTTFARAWPTSRTATPSC